MALGSWKVLVAALRSCFLINKYRNTCDFYCPYLFWFLYEYIVRFLCPLPRKSLWKGKGGRLFPIHAARSRGRCKQCIMVWGREQQWQHCVTGLVIQMETVATIAKFVGHGQYVGERRAFCECHSPLETIPFYSMILLAYKSRCSDTSPHHKHTITHTWLRDPSTCLETIMTAGLVPRLGEEEAKAGKPRPAEAEAEWATCWPILPCSPALKLSLSVKVQAYIRMFLLRELASPVGNATGIREEKDTCGHIWRKENHNCSHWFDVQNNNFFPGRAINCIRFIIVTKRKSKSCVKRLPFPK